MPVVLCKLVETGIQIQTYLDAGLLEGGLDEMHRLALEIIKAWMSPR